MELTTSILLGIGLSAACGFRIFVPLLALSIASRLGYVGELSEGFAWVASYPAMITFAVATVVEIAGYYVPWIDNALDTIAAPAAVVAGILVTATVMGDADPYFKWTVAVIAGGGVAGTVQVATTAVRFASSTLTGGLGNSGVSSVEAGSSVTMSIISITLPLVAVILVVLLFIFMFSMLKKWRKKKAAAKEPENPIGEMLGDMDG